MMCTAYFGEISKARNDNWNNGATAPYEVLQTFVPLEWVAHKVLDYGSDYFSEKIKVDWGCFAWRCSAEQISAFLHDFKSILPWLAERDEEMIRSVETYIAEHPDGKYGVVFVEVF